MISESATGMSNGGRVSSATDAIMNTMNSGNSGIAYHSPCCASMMAIREVDAASITAALGTLSLVGITEAQGPYWFVLTQPVMFGIFILSALAELTRTPFDMPIAESEIIFGAYTEYTGLKFAFFLLSEYGGIVVMSAVASVLFLGGYLPLPGLSVIPGPIWMFGKIFALSFVIVWLRATFPRLREDQLQRFAWIKLVPVTLLWILGVAFVKVANA